MRPAAGLNYRQKTRKMKKRRYLLSSLHCRCFHYQSALEYQAFSATGASRILTNLENSQLERPCLTRTAAITSALPRGDPQTLDSVGPFLYKASDTRPAMRLRLAVWARSTSIRLARSGAPHSRR